jgi:zinc protease
MKSPRLIPPHLLGRVACRALALVVLVAACSSRVALPEPTRPLTPSPDAPFRAAPPPVEATRVLPPDVRTAELANGMRILVVERPALPLVTLVWASHAAHDGDAPHEAGLAALTAYALTQGTRLSDGRELAYLHVNGEAPLIAVDRDGSVVSIHTPAADVAVGVDTLAAVVRRPLFTPAGIQAARADQLEAMGLRSLAIGYRLRDAAFLGLFGEQHPPVTPFGSHANVVKLTPAAVSSFHAAHYAPESSALVAVGALTLAQAVALANAHFGDWPRSAAPPAPPALAPPRPREPSRPIQGLMGGGSRAHFVLALPCPSAGDPRESDLDLLAMVFANLPLSRTTRLLRHEEGISYSISARCETSRNLGTFWVEFAVEPERGGDALAIVMNEIKRLREEDVPAAELELAKLQLLGQIGGYLSTNAGIARMLAMTFMHGEPPDILTRQIERIQVATSAELRASAQYFWNRHLGIATYGARDLIEAGLARFGNAEWSSVHD